MTKSRHIKRGVKREHSIIEGLLPLLERIAKIEGIKKVVPAKISYSPKRNIGKNMGQRLIIKFQRQTISGFKLLAHGRGTIQEIFVAIDGSENKEKKYIENKLKEELDSMGVS